MRELDKTTVYRSIPGGRGQFITVFDGPRPPFVVDLGEWAGETVSFGRQEDNDIVLRSPLVSRHHGRFSLREGRWTVQDAGSRNGLACNDATVEERVLADGDILRIDDGQDRMREGVLFVVSSAGSSDKWKSVAIGSGELTIGRSSDCDIVLDHVSVSRRHAVIRRRGDGWVLADQRSANGVMLNGAAVNGEARLREKDVIAITNSKLIFTAERIYYCCFRGGVSVEVRGLSVRRGRGRRARTTLDRVSLDIARGELVAIIGGSGAGKSTLLNAMCGGLAPQEGGVSINGLDLYANLENLKRLIGYVPQSDIVYDNLTLYDMLRYTADLRLPNDVSGEERERVIARSIETVGLSEKRDSLIRLLSGGQRKRASIAVELLSDPSLLYLDEPASGLDPGTERSLMRSLRQMADSGRTVVLVTHSTLQLQLCDKLIILGKGGKLCYFGAYEGALAFFNVNDIVDVYEQVTDRPDDWRSRYEESVPKPAARGPAAKVAAGGGGGKLSQLPVLCARALKLIARDRQRMLLLLLQGPILTVLISLVADGRQFRRYASTPALLYALACAAFWVGMLNAVQEICKEYSVLRREYMAGLSLSAYIGSKLVVMGLLCAVQGALLTGGFALLVGLPARGVFTWPGLEMYITTTLTAFAASGTGLMVSALMKNADRAMALAPILLMPQILFSGLAFPLSGITKRIAWFTVCRWSFGAYGTIADLNGLRSWGMQYEPLYDYSARHLTTLWGILALFVVVQFALSRCFLGNVRKERG